MPVRVNGGPESLANGRIHGSRSSSSTSTVSAKPLDVEELEMLLEAYFVQVDGTLNKLSTVSFFARFSCSWCSMFCILHSAL